ncbi:MAG: iron-sulfur cluster assembly scaffold protein [Desulfobacteraceae bacterium]|nr:iron-sulfur cluster assembly scaffold protein [Desulfobacteraceae bacterium]
MESESMGRDGNELLASNLSPRFLEMALRTDRCLPMERPDGRGKKTGVCGDTVEFNIVVERGILKTLTYQVEGCLHTNACANALISLVEGRPVEEVWEILPEAVAERLETLPDDHFHCAELAVGALFLALADAQHRARNPVRKIYGRSR